MPKKIVVTAAAFARAEASTGCITCSEFKPRLAVWMEVQPPKSNRVTFPVQRRVLQQQEGTNVVYIKDVSSRRGEKALP